MTIDSPGPSLFQSCLRYEGNRVEIRNGKSIDSGLGLVIMLPLFEYSWLPNQLHRVQF